MATMHEIEAWVLIDSDGEYVAHHDPESIHEFFVEQIGELAERDGLRLVKITLKVPLPEIIEVSGAVTINEQVGELKAVAG